MKRFKLVLLCMALLLLTACDKEEVVPSEGVVSGQPDVSADVSAEPVREEITFTAEHEKSMRDYLSTRTYMIFSQSMDNGIQGQSSYSTTRYSLSVNVEQKIQSLTMRYIIVNGMSHEGVGYSIYSNADKTIVSEDGVWKEATSEYSNLAWDLSNFDNDLDIYDYLMNGLELPIGHVGVSYDDYWTFEWKEPADDSLLVGLEYDELLEASFKYTFRYVKETVVPNSVTVRVGYKIEDVQYYVESVIQFSSIGNTLIAMPEIGSKV